MPPGVGQILGPNHWERALSCVNALVGIKNPEAIKELIAFVRGFADQDCYDDPGEYPEEGEAGKAPCQSCEARSIIAKLEGK